MRPAKKTDNLFQKFGDLETIIPELSNRYGQKEAARRLGVPQSFLSVWLATHGYKKRVVWEKQKDAS